MKRATVFGAWTAIALALEASLLLHQRAGVRDPEPFVPQLLGQLAWCWIFAALTPLVARICAAARRAPAGAGALIHLGGAAVVTLVHEAAYLPLSVLLARDPLGAGTLAAALRREGPLFAAFVGIYAGMAAAVDAFQSAARARTAAEAAARLETEIADAELDRLTKRLDPERFFTSLEDIVAKLRTSPRDAERLVVELGDTLRLAVEADADLTASGSARAPSGGSPRA